MKTVTKTGKTVDEAVEAAIAELGCTKEEAQIEVISEGSEGGFLSRIADVCINLPADKPKDVQELTLPVYHFLCLALEKYYFDSESII